MFINILDNFAKGELKVVERSSLDQKINGTGSNRFVIMCNTNLKGIKGEIATTSYKPHADFIAISPVAMKSFIKALRMIDMQALSVPEGIIKIVHEASGETIVEKNIGGVQETLNEFQLAMAEASAFAEYITGEKL